MLTGETDKNMTTPNASVNPHDRNQNPENKEKAKEIEIDMNEKNNNKLSPTTGQEIRMTKKGINQTNHVQMENKEKEKEKEKDPSVLERLVIKIQALIWVVSRYVYLSIHLYMYAFMYLSIYLAFTKNNIYL